MAKEKDGSFPGVVLPRPNRAWLGSFLHSLGVNMAGGIVSSTEFQHGGGRFVESTIRDGKEVPVQITSGTQVTVEVGGKQYSTSVAGIKHDPQSLRALALDRLAREGNAAAKAELPRALEELKRNGGASQLKTLERLSGSGVKPGGVAAPVRGAGTLRAMGPLGIFSTVLGAIADEKDAKDPAKVKAIADQIRRGELRFDMLPPFSPLTDKVREELNAGEMA